MATGMLPPMSPVSRRPKDSVQGSGAKAQMRCPTMPPAMLPMSRGRRPKRSL